VSQCSAVHAHNLVYSKVENVVKALWGPLVGPDYPQLAEVAGPPTWCQCVPVHLPPRHAACQQWHTCVNKQLVENHTRMQRMS